MENILDESYGHQVQYLRMSWKHFHLNYNLVIGHVKETLWGAFER